MCGELDQPLEEVERGLSADADDLLPLVYDELRAIAARHLRHERGGHTLQPTALAHEAYLRLANQRRAAWANRPQFLAVASCMIRRILVDHARHRLAAKRGGGHTQSPIQDADVPFEATDEGLVELSEALDQLRDLNPRQSAVVEMRYFGGMTIEETADILNISPQTVKVEWRIARAWLRTRLET